ncbi:MAG: DNA mismatch endonuclease Vsr [Oscillospiraceae bacterium]|nr:DNA mismatch endonuclease Vsr [Oscillospiraceae bacterium]
MAQRTQAQISYNMSRIRDRDTKIEKLLRNELIRRGITTFVSNEKSIVGKPDFAFPARKIAVFCDSEFWHGHDWESRKKDFKTNEQSWIPKIEKNIARDAFVTQTLRNNGWRVLRFWGEEIKRDVYICVNEIEGLLRITPVRPFRVVDLCAGIGGIRRGFERGLGVETVLTAEIDKYACATYEHIFGTNPHNDLTTAEFKTLVGETDYEILLAGFPCQTFSRVGLKEGFENEEKGQIFFHIAKIIEATRPAAFFLENVDHIVTRDNGNTFKLIIETLEAELKYKVIGVTTDSEATSVYRARDFVRNSRAFGVPQNRPRTYIIGFDKERFRPERLALLPSELPKGRKQTLYGDLNDLLERDVPPRYYMASGYFETLVRHRERQEGRGYGFGYRIINEPDIEHPVANTILATGGSGRERNLIRDPREGIAGMMVQGKKTPLNDQGIRVMTPTEWGKLQGFINYGFLREDGTEGFSFPEDMPDIQKYKQFGNSVTIPAVEEMARFMGECFDILREGREQGGGERL